MFVLAAEALAKGGSGPTVSEVGAAAAAEEEEQEEEEEEISAAGIADVLGYRVFLGNEQWQVSWAEEESERTWERLEVLDTAALRRRADADWGRDAVRVAEDGRVDPAWRCEAELGLDIGRVREAEAGRAIVLAAGREHDAEDGRIVPRESLSGRV